MKISPIQLSNLVFRRISVELDSEHVPAAEADASNLSLTFESVHIATHVGLAPVDEDAETGKRYFLTLRVLVDNKADEDDDEQCYAPYRVDIEAGAEIRALPGSEELDDPEDLVVVNGTSVLWSAIREQLSSLTARMPAGEATLPTVHFNDLRREAREQADES